MHPAQPRGSRSCGVVGRDIANCTVEALVSELFGEGAELNDPADILTCEARDVAAERLKTRGDPGVLGTPTPRCGNVPVVVDDRKNSRGYLQIAIQLVPLGDGITRIDQVALLARAHLHRCRRHPGHRGEEALHEYTPRARMLIPGARQRVADLERVRKVTGAVDHEPMTEAVNALVTHEQGRRRQNGAHAPCLCGDELLGHPGESALDDAVVVAGPTCHCPVPQRLRGVTVVPRQRSMANLV